MQNSSLSLQPLYDAGQSIGLPPVATVAIASAAVGYALLGTRGLILGPALAGGVFVVGIGNLFRRVPPEGI